MIILISIALMPLKTDVFSAEYRIFLPDGLPHIEIVGAKRYVSEDGSKMVEVTLKNVTREYTKEVERRYESGAPYYEVTVEDEIDNVYVYLRSNGVIITTPYEQRIPALKYNQEKTLSFELLKNVNELDIGLEYLGSYIERRVRLLKDTTSGDIRINSVQFAQEGNLGSDITYDISIETLTGAEGTYKLLVSGLPEDITSDFIDPKTNARLSSTKFTEEEYLKDLSLVVYLPEELKDKELLDNTITFYALVVDQKVEVAAELQARGKAVPKELMNLRGTNVELMLTPRGVGELELYASNLFEQIKPGEKAHIRMSVKNKGTLELRDIKIETSIPYQWEIELDPEKIDSLPVGKEQLVKMTLTPPPEEGVGDFELVVSANCTVNNKLVESEEKSVRINLGKPAGITGNIILTGVLIVLVIGVAIFTVRLSRR